MKARRKETGFSVVEIMIISSIIILLLMIVLPAQVTARNRHDAAVLAGNLRTYAIAFKEYADLNGSFPEDAARGHVPEGMEGKLPLFDAPSVLGGFWDWDFEPASGRAEINLLHPTDRYSVLEKLDSMVDDGNLGTGCLVYNGMRLTLFLAD